jgi:predicted cupin superfamily sugar epimerase
MVGNDLTADEIRSLLNLESNATCGFVRETYRATQAIAPGGLTAPFADGRPLGSALYFMVTPAAPVKLHRIRNDGKRPTPVLIVTVGGHVGMRS